MDEPGFEAGFLSASRVAIFGLGLMGGSLALALKGKCAEVVGIDTDEQMVTLAKERAVVDIALNSDTVVRKETLALENIDIIILAAPVRAILKILDDLPELISGQAIVLDLGSTKTCIVAKMDELPIRFDPVGGHPMCGKEQSSLLYAEAGIYMRATFAFVALEKTTTRAKHVAEEIARAVGAIPVWLDAQLHDRWVAATSHAPFLVASALSIATPVDAAPMVGPGFRGTARLSASSPRMMVDILATNTENILAAIEEVKKALEKYEELIRQDEYERLAEIFSRSSERYQVLRGKQ